MRTKINKKSDFDFIVLDSEGNPIPFPTDDFSLFLWTWGSKSRFKASSINGVLTGCKNEDNKLRVFVDNPGFVPGKLVGELVTYITNDTYDDGVQRTCRYISDFGIDMVNEDSETNEVQVLAMMQYIQGASAYEIACEYGYEGTEEEWLATLSLESRTAANECRELMAEFTADENVREANEEARKAAEISREEKQTTLFEYNNIIFYPYSNRFFKIEFLDSGNLNVYFDGLNIRGKNIYQEKTIGTIISEVGQSNSRYIELKSFEALVYNMAENKFYVRKELTQNQFADVVLFRNSSTADGLVDVHPSLSYWVYGKKTFILSKNLQGNISLQGKKVIITPEGFGINISGIQYYVATTTDKTDNYEFDLNIGWTSSFLVLDSSKLKRTNFSVSGRVELSDVLSVKKYPSYNDIAIAYSYTKSEEVNGTYLIGQFRDIFGIENSFARSFSIYGNGDEYVKHIIRGLISGRTYAVCIGNSNSLGLTGYTGTNWKFGIVANTNDGIRNTLVYSDHNEDYENINQDRVVTINVPENTDSVTVGIRADAGEKIDFDFIDLSMDYIICGDNVEGNNVKIGNDITILENGFSVKNKYTGRIIGYVGYVAGEDENKTYTISGDSSSQRTYFSIKKSVLSKDKRASFSKSIVKRLDSYIPADEILLCIFKGQVLIYLNEGLVGNFIQGIMQRLSYSFVYNNAQNTTNVTLANKKIFINPGGFGINFNNSIYYIATTDANRIEPYIFDFSINKYNPGYLVLDTTKLISAGVRTELSDVLKIKSSISVSDIVLAYDYPPADRDVVLIGQFRDFFCENNSTIDNNTINNDILFSPEFYAYAYGRHNDSNGVGTGWYERFRLIHISDTHRYDSQYKEALQAANAKVHAIINTGDDSNGIDTSSGALVNADLSATSTYIKAYNKVHYLQVPGNHDVPGITKQDYFNKICSVIKGFSPNVVWGDEVNYRAYGYIDFTRDEYYDKFRIIMLDPFDYDDGLFENTYSFQSAIFSQKQIDWLVNSLVDAAEQGLNVITMMHYSFGDNSLNFNKNLAKPDALFYQDSFMIPDIIDAIQHGSVINKNYADTKGLNNISINRDFSAVPNLKYVAHLFGHIHSKNHYRCQKTDGSKKYDMLMLGEAALGTYGNALNKAYRKSGTINGIAFSALEIDTIEKTIYRVSYGSYLNYDKSNSERTTKLKYRFED